MNLQIRLTPDLAAQLAYIEQHTHQDTETIIQNAIAQQYQQLQANSPNAFQLFEAAGLVGCIDGSPDLSTQYQSTITDYLANKQDQEQL
jgi:predicted transcriptional regulator